MKEFVLLGTLLLALAAAKTTCAQEDLTRFELGAQFSTIRQTDSNLRASTSPGFGGRFDWNLNRRLAFESQLDFFPREVQPLYGIQGGRTVQAVLGLRAKVIQTRRLSVFGLIRPGFFRFTNVQDFSGDLSTAVTYHPETHFVLNLGGGIEFYPSPHWVMRVDLEGDPYRVPNKNVGAVPTTTGVSSPATLIVGKVNDTTRFSFGAAYRPGRLINNEEEVKVAGKWELGPLFSTLMIAREGLADGVRTEPGAGGFVSYKIYRIFYLDGDILYFPRATKSSGPHDGGEILQGFVGVKGGIRRNRYGIFGKVRPGFHSYSEALSGVTTASVQTDRSTNFVLDLGGIVEIYPEKRSTLRLEAGDTHIYFGSRDVNVDGTVVSVPGGKLQHTIQFILGYGWRF